MRKKLFYEFIGAKIKQKREEKGLTIDELSLKTGIICMVGHALLKIPMKIRKIYLQKIEEGKASRFSTTKLFMIAEALETHASMLVIGWEEFLNSSTQ